MLRKAALAFALVLVCACSGQNGRAPFADSKMPPAMAPRFYPPAGWTWGLIRVAGQPAQRYGVSAPAFTSRASILILTGYDDPAEAWFETIGWLNRRGYVVWLLERSGQGGSGRRAFRRDLGHVSSFEPDAEATRRMIRDVIRPSHERPLVVLGHSVGGVVAVRALERGAAVDSLILSAPALGLSIAADVAPKVRLARAVGLGGLRAPGEGGWSAQGRPGAAGRLTHDPVRGHARTAWAETNPALRMGGPSLGWLAAYFDAADKARGGAGSVEVPTLLLTAGDDALVDNQAATSVCRSMPSCRQVAIAGAWHDLPREADPMRQQWLDAVDGFARQRMTTAGR